MKTLQNQNLYGKEHTVIKILTVTILEKYLKSENILLQNFERKCRVLQNCFILKLRFFILWFHVILILISLISYQFNVNIQSTRFWLFVPIPCGKIIEKKKRKKQSWAFLALLLRGYLWYRHMKKLSCDISSMSEHCSNSSFLPHSEKLLQLLSQLR